MMHTMDNCYLSIYSAKEEREEGLLYSVGFPFGADAGISKVVK